MADGSGSGKPPNGPVVLVEMVSDVVCPWCWIGKRRFDKARAAAGAPPVRLVLRPFELDPNIPKDGVPRDAYMAARFPDAAKLSQMTQHLEEVGAQEGIAFNFSAIKKRPNTLSAHAVIRWAQGQDQAAGGGATIGEDAKEALFRAYFQDGLDIGNRDVLAGIAGAVGLDGALVASLLDRGTDLGAVSADAHFFREAGVSGVPTFIANRRLAAIGAQEPAALVDFLRQAALPSA